jgi:hypothetical protein
VSGKKNLWTKPVAKLVADSSVSLELQPADYLEMEKLFSVPSVSASGDNTVAGVDMKDGIQVEKKKKIEEVKTDEIRI